MSSIFYLCIIFVQLLFVGLFAYYLRKYHAQTTYQFVLCALMIILYAYEFSREIRIALGNYALVNEIRLIILRIEHTIMGLFLSEVFHYVYKYYQKTYRCS